MYIETNRLILRDMSVNDSKDCFDYLSNPETMKFIEHTFDFNKTKLFIKKCGIEHKFVYSLLEKESEKVIGHIIFHQFEEDPLEFELGWILNENYQNKGFAYEISTKLLKHSFHELKLKKVVAEVLPDNKSSIGLLKKLGFKESERSADSELLLFQIGKSKNIHNML